MNTLKKADHKNIILLSFLFIFIMYLLPSFIQFGFDDNLKINEVYIGLPGVISGDEPHYFVTTTSIINDHDLYISNNYDNTYLYGGCDVSFHYINNTNPGIGKHIQYFDKENKIVLAGDIFLEYNEDMISLKEEFGVDQLVEIPARPIALPVFSSLFLWPLKGTCLIEHGAIYISILISLIGIWFFYQICIYYIRKFSPELKRKQKERVKNIRYLALIFTLIFALCTQYWHYSKTYFTEPYLAVALISAYYLFFIKKKSVLPGFILAIGFSMKYPFGMYLALFGLTILLKKEWKRIVYFILGSIPPIAGVFYYNWFLSGNILQFGRTEFIAFGNHIGGFLSWMFNPIFGLLPFAPFLVFSILGLIILYKKDKKELLLISSMVFPYMIFWTSYTLTQVGAGGYSSRYMIPLLFPLTLLCLIWYLNNTNKTLKIIFITLIIISFIINIQAAFLHPVFWHNPPWAFIKIILSNPEKIVQLLTSLF